MKVNQSYAIDEIIQRQDTKIKTENEKFLATLDKAVSQKADTKILNKIDMVSDADVENFLNKLTSMGASAFWFNYNLEKIQDKIDRKREELMKELGIDDETAKKDVAFEILDEMLEKYIQTLLEQMEKRFELKNISENSPLNEIFGKNNPLNI